MAIRQNKSQDEDKPSKRFPLVGSLESRSSSSSKDQRFINMYPEVSKDKNTSETSMYLIKRPGYTLESTVVSAGAVGRGLYYWNNNLWSVFGNKVYKNTTEVTGITLTTSSGTVGFTEVSGTTNYLFFCDGTYAYLITTADVVIPILTGLTAWVTATNYALGDKRIPTVANGFYYTVTTDAGSSSTPEPTWPTTIGNTVVDGGITWTCTGYHTGIPSPHAPQPVFLDGYVFLTKAGTGQIWNSALEDPKTWNNEFIETEMFPDNVLGLTRHLNQIIAFGRLSTEFFYDQGNVSTSPLGRTEGTSFQFGIAAPGASVSTEQYVIVPTQAEQGGRAVHIFKGFETKKISTEYIDRILDAEGTNIINAQAYTVRVNGHYFYVLLLSSRTLVLDIDELYWTEWSTNNSGTHAAFPFNYSTDKQTGKLLIQHNTNGKIYNLDQAALTDAGTSILCEGWTRKYDWETMSRKFNHGVYWVADDPGSTTTLSFRWTDDDYQNWSNWKTVDLHTRSFFPRLGAFRRRAFNFKTTADVALRLEALEFTDLQTGHN